MDTGNSLKKIVEYFKKNLSKGYTCESLKWALINQGYSKVLVEKAIVLTNEELAKKAPVLKEKPKIEYEIIDEHDKPVAIKNYFWKKILSYFKKFN